MPQKKCKKYKEHLVSHLYRHVLQHFIYCQYNVSCLKPELNTAALKAQLIWSFIVTMFIMLRKIYWSLSRRIMFNSRIFVFAYVMSGIIELEIVRELWRIGIMNARTRAYSPNGDLRRGRAVGTCSPWISP